MSDKEKYGWNHDMICDSTTYYRMQGYSCAFSRDTKATLINLKEIFIKSESEFIYRKYIKDENTKKD